jgi:cyclohexadieny/prephenate dehydrogenase
MSFERVAIIGLGLLGGSIGLAVQECLPDVHTTGYDADPATAPAQAERGLVAQVCDSAAEAVRDADLVIFCVPPGAMGVAAAELAERWHRACAGQRCRIIQAINRQGAGRGAAERQHHPGASGRRYREFRAGRGLCQPVPEPLVHHHPARDANLLRRRALVAFWEALGANVEDHGRQAPRSGAGRHQPPAAPDRLYHRRHRFRP